MEWRDIPNFEGYYQISEFGDIRNTKTGKIRKTRPNVQHGYIDIDLYKDGKVFYKRINRLVAETYLSHPEDIENYCVMHKDNNKLNNHYSNLRWGTISENTKQAYDDELIDLNKIYSLIKDENNIKIKGLDNVCEETGYSSSQILDYIKTQQYLKRGKYKGYKIKKLG